MNAKQITLRLSIYRTIRKIIGSVPAETGAMLGGDPVTGIVSEIHFDRDGARSLVSYSPDVKTLNRVLETEWNPKGIRLLGFCHSHPTSVRQPSSGDMAYASAILGKNPDLPYLLLPIVMSKADAGEFELLGYIVWRERKKMKFEKIEFVVVPEKGLKRKATGKRRILLAEALSTPNGDSDRRNAKDLSQAAESSLTLTGQERASKSGETTQEPGAAPAPDNEVVSQSPGENRLREAVLAAYQQNQRSANSLTVGFLCAENFNYDETFRRVKDSYDLAQLAACRVICSGTGSAAGFVDNLMRCGVEKFVLIDPDIVNESNLGTCLFYRNEIGLPKVRCLANRILNFNPTASVIALQKRLEDIDDEEFGTLCFAPRETDHARATPPVLTLLCGMADSFHAQARMNRLSLDFGLPSMLSQLYREGRAAEVTWVVPGFSKCCHRCILSSRYRAYLEKGFKNDVSSFGTTSYAATRINALRTFMALAILHRGSNHPRWAGLLERIGTRQLIQIRMDPDVEASLGLKNFTAAFSGADANQIFSDETIWRPQVPESPATGYPVPCPDCGGSGDLLQARKYSGPC